MICIFLIRFILLGLKKSLGHAQIGLFQFRGLIQNFRRASVPPSYAESLPPREWNLFSSTFCSTKWQGNFLDFWCRELLRKRDSRNRLFIICRQGWLSAVESWVGLTFVSQSSVRSRLATEPPRDFARMVFLEYPCSKLECSGISAGFYLNRSNLERLIPVYSSFITVSQKCILRMYQEWAHSKMSSYGNILCSEMRGSVTTWHLTPSRPLMSCGCRIYNQGRN